MKTLGIWGAQQETLSFRQGSPVASRMIPGDCQVSTSTASSALGWNRAVSVMLSLFKPCLALNFQLGSVPFH